MRQPVDHAIEQVQAVQKILLCNQLFRGYSARARWGGGMIALVGASILSIPDFPSEQSTHLVAWSVICACAVLLNYGSLMRWYFQIEPHKRRAIRLQPVVDSIWPLVVGAIISIGLVRQGQFDFLFGTWMCLYGLTNIASRHSLPAMIEKVGYFYIVSGLAMLLLIPELKFTNPWPMGIVFFLGESFGAYVFSCAQPAVKDS